MKKKKIMIIDDEKDFLKMVRLNLELTGRYEVLTLPDAASVISQAHKFKPDIILLDMIMPGMGGIDVLKEIKKLDPGVTVIMVTVVTDHEQAKKTLELGAYDYITKPVDLNYLENVVMVKLLD